MHPSVLEVERELKKLADPSFQASNDKFHIPRSVGISSLRLKSRLKQGFSFSKRPESEQWKIWNDLLRNSRLHEAQMAALRFAEDRVATNGKREWNYLRGWADFVDNWAHSDVLSKIYSCLLEHHPELILPQLKKWNASKNPWKQRASVVSLIYYASPKRNAPNAATVLEMVKPLLPAQDPFVQKGVGWTLREAYNLYPKETLAFLERHIRDLSAIAFSSSTEKLDALTKEALKKRRVGT
ncbi:DNA alkylation repair protein [Candidatus Parcubacteria bacterium]|nr:DNA alkylation repair protein [Candidatus Parcubacteria bacterium]